MMFHLNIGDDYDDV